MSDSYVFDEDQATVNLPWSISKPTTAHYDQPSSFSHTSYHSPNDFSLHQKPSYHLPHSQEEEYSSTSSTVAYGHPNYSNDDCPPTQHVSLPSPNNYVRMEDFINFQNELSEMLIKMNSERKNLEMQLLASQDQCRINLEQISEDSSCRTDELRSRNH